MAAYDLKLVEAMMPYAQPGTLPTIRKSQMLADALDSLREHGGENLRTPASLWGKLGAQALLTYGRDKNFGELQGQLTKDQAGLMGSLMQGLPGHEDAGPAAALGEALSPTPQAPAAPQAPALPAGAQTLFQPGPIRDQKTAMPAEAAAPPAAPAPQPSSVPTQIITPEQMAQLERYAQSPYPQVRAKAIELAARLQEQRLTPIDPSKPQFVADGKGGFKVRDLGKEVTSMPGDKPGQIKEITNSTGAVDFKDSGVMGATPPGQVFQNGANVQIPSVVGGRTQDRNYTPSDLAEVRSKVLGSEEYKMAAESLKAYEAMVANATQPGGMSAYAMRDTFARAINPGAVARSGTLQAIAEARGIPDSVKGFLLNLKGDGDLSDNTKQQIIDATLPFVQANAEAVKRLNKSNSDWATRHGIDPLDVTADIGPDPQPFKLRKPANGAPPPPRVGEVRNGRPYLGGNPADPKSWGPRQ